MLDRIQLRNQSPLGRIPSYDQGTPYVPEDQLAMIHQGEEVVPANENPNADSAKMEELKAQGYPMGEQSDNPVFPTSKQFQQEPQKPKTDQNNALEGKSEQAPASPLGRIQAPKMQSNKINPLFSEFDPQKTNPSLMNPGGGMDLTSQPSFGNDANAPIDKEKKIDLARPQETNKEEVSPDITAIMDHQKAMLTKEAADKAAKGDLLGAGNAKLALKQLGGDEPMGPAFPNPGKPEYGGTQKAMDTENHKEFENKLHDYDARAQAALAQGNIEEHDKILLAKMGYQKLNPYGSANNHPGVLGKIEHGLAKAGNIAGTVFAPSTMALIPGTDLNKGMQENALRGDIEKEQALNTAENKETNVPVDQQLAKANAELSAAATPEAKAAAQTKVDNLTKALQATHPQQPKNDPLNQQYLDAEQEVAAATTPEAKAAAQQKLQQIESAINATNAPKKETDELTNKFTDVMGKAAKTGKYNMGSINPIKDIIEPAKKAGDISTEEASDAEKFLANPHNAPAVTKVDVHNADDADSYKRAMDKHFQGSEVIATMSDGKRVQMSYGQAKEQGLDPNNLEKLTAKQSQDNRDKHASLDTTFTSLDNYRSLYKNAKLTSQDRDALRVLTDHAPEKAGGILDGLFNEIPVVGPLDKYANKLLNGTMTSDQYNQLSPDGKKIVSAYFTSVVDNFASMKARLGSVGRNPTMIAAETNTIPLPYLDWNSADTAFNNKRRTMAGVATEWPDLYKPNAK